MDQGSTMKRSAVHNFAPTVTKFCVMWEGQALPHDTKFGNSRCEIVGRRVIFIWSLIHGLRWSGLIKAEPGLDNGLPPGWHQAIIWTNAGILLIGPLGTNFSEFMIGSHTLSFKKMHLKISSTKWHPFGLILNVLITFPHRMISFQMATQKSPATWSGLMPFR